MPKGPKGQKRPADVIGNAVKVMRIATGEEEDIVADDGKDPAARSLGSRGGKARAKNLTKSSALRHCEESGASALARQHYFGRCARVAYGGAIFDSVGIAAAVE